MQDQALNKVSTPEMVTPKELIWKHIKDPNHVITEEEFSRLVVGLNTIEMPAASTN